jgi:hypothetical protein
MPRQIEGSQTDFSFGEVDVTLKRNDQHPARKGGLRQMANTRILNSGAFHDRSGRRALFPEDARTEEVLMSPGNVFYLSFGLGFLHVRNAAGALVFSTTFKGDGVTPISWNPLNEIVWVTGPGPQLFSIYITYFDGTTTNVPQVLTWDGVSQTSTWTLATFAETVSIGNQKMTPFFRISPPNITMLPGNNGAGVSTSVTFSAPVLVPGMVGTRFTFVGQQVLLTAVASPTSGTILIEQNLPLGMLLAFPSNPATTFNIGDVVEGSISGASGIVVSFPSSTDNVIVQLLQNGEGQILQFVQDEIVVGPGGSLTIVNGGVQDEVPQAVSVWDDEVMNNFRGFPTSCFVDQNRLGFCNFPSVSNGICWSQISAPTSLFTGAQPDDSIFEIAPNKSQVLFVVPGPEGSEFVFTNIGLWYIPISPTNPLIPGSVAFNLLSQDGAAQVQPRVAQEAILYVNAGQTRMMAVIATGALTRPFNTKQLSEFHQHLFNDIQCIAAPTADGTFIERYAYVLNGNGSIAVGKYEAESLQGGQPVIGWGPWSGSGTVSFISARAADVIFSSSYFGVGICEVLDDTQFLDAALLVNSLPAPFAPPAGKGPLFFIAGQSVTLIDQGTRAMGTYQIDANGNIIPQFNGGENLEIASLVAGQPWTMTVEPFAPISQPGSDLHQRTTLRQISLIGVYVINSTGFTFQSLFSSKQTPTSPALGTPRQFRRFPPWNQGDNPILPPPLREILETWTPPGSSFDPRVAIVKDVPGPLEIQEIAIEISI